MAFKTGLPLFVNLVALLVGGHIHLAPSLSIFQGKSYRAGPSICMFDRTKKGLFIHQKRKTTNFKQAYPNLEDA